MTPPAIRRWSFAFLAGRWRHVFWIVPLIALLAGMLVEGRAYLRGQEARCVIQYRPFSTATLGDLRELILSDAFLEEARISSGSRLPPAEVREIVRCEKIKGTSLLVISAKGRSSATKVDLCNALADLAAAKTAGARDEAELHRWREEESKVESLEAEVELKRRDLSILLRRESGSLLDHSRPIAKPKLEAAKQNLGAAQMALESAHRALFASQMGCRFWEEPVFVHERASPAPSFSLAMLGPPLWHLSIWIGSGFVAAILLAFLLEAMSPAALSARSA